MVSSRPVAPWYQFSLRSALALLLLTAFLCSLGVCTHWLAVAAVASVVLIAGVAGRITSGTRLGFVQGVVFGIQSLIWAIIVCSLFPRICEAPWRLYAVIEVAILAGGILGGLTVRPLSR